MIVQEPGCMETLKEMGWEFDAQDADSLVIKEGKFMTMGEVRQWHLPQQSQISQMITLISVALPHHPIFEANHLHDNKRMCCVQVRKIEDAKERVKKEQAELAKEKLRKESQRMAANASAAGQADPASPSVKVRA